MDTKDIEQQTIEENVMQASYALIGRHSTVNAMCLHDQ